MTGTESILFAVAIIGSVIGIIGFFSGREKTAKDEVKEAAEWRGNVNGKLDSILGLTNRVEVLEDKVEDHEIKISKLQDQSTRAHERLDLHIDGHKDIHRREDKVN